MFHASFSNVLQLENVKLRIMQHFASIFGQPFCYHYENSEKDTEGIQFSHMQVKSLSKLVQVLRIPGKPELEIKIVNAFDNHFQCMMTHNLP